MSDLKNNPKISVIVPVYNVEKYLRRCLDSIAAQTFTDWECICIDDGSPDGSGAICDEYAQDDSRFVVIHKENGGVSSARNAGLDAARGEWIAFVDSDDWIEKETYDEAFKTAMNTNADMIQWGYCRSDGKHDYDIRVYHSDYNLYNFKNTLKEDEPYFGFCLTLIRKQILSANKIVFSMDMTMGEDYIFSLQCYLSAKRVVNIKNKYFYHYFQNPNSACHNLSLEYKEAQIFFINYFESMVKQTEYKDSLMTIVNRLKAGFKIKMLKEKNIKYYKKNFVEIEPLIYKKFKVFRPAMFFLQRNLNLLAKLYIDVIKLLVALKNLQFQGK